MSSIPNHATVLVIGGGPAGSYTASALAREGVDVALLEADVFPRYHIGESMLPTMRFFLRLIDAESTFDAQGFQKKFGASFKISEKAVAYSDFSITLGPGGHSWNVVRSQADHLLFKHANKQGAQTFDGVKVNEIMFEPYNDDAFASADLKMAKVANPGRPVAATWSRKDGSSGNITFDYLVDASGRAGIMSTKYLKNRNLNEGLKNIANWTYWKNAEKYGAGTAREGSPFFEALEGRVPYGSGWCWYIALHDGTISVGVVMRQDLFFAKKKKLGSPPPEELYKECLKLTPQISELLKNGEISTDIKMASDWSYNASAYSGPHFRMIGDAGCFIDPYFSSGVHLALSSGLSAALTIQASRKGECSEFTAAKWHSSKVREGYTRFLVVVMICLRQLRKPDHSILSGEDVDNYDAAFAAIQPGLAPKHLLAKYTPNAFAVIQGTADAEAANVPAQARAANTVKFALGKFQDQTPQQQREALTCKLEEVANKPEELEKLSEEEVRILNDMTSAHVAQISAEKSINELANDVFDGLTANLERGKLGLQEMVALKHGEAGVAGKQAVMVDDEKAGSTAEEPTVEGNDPVGWPTEVKAH